MSSKIRSLMSEMRSGLASLYGPRLRGVYLYGSYARDEADRESDVDVLVVLDHVVHYADEVERTSHLISSLSLQSGVSISRVFVSEQDWSVHSTPFLDNVWDEAVPA
jgi:type I restriction enzyme S subunit